MKSEKRMRAEGRKISRAIDNYTAIHQTQAEAEAQTKLNEAGRQ